MSADVVVGVYAFHTPKRHITVISVLYTSLEALIASTGSPTPAERYYQVLISFMFEVEAAVGSQVVLLAAQCAGIELIATSFLDAPDIQRFRTDYFELEIITLLLPSMECIRALFSACFVFFL